MSNYNSVTPEFIDELKTLLGEKYVKTDADTLDRYKTDEEADERCFHLPDVVVIPANAEEIAGVVKLCNKYLIPLTVRGGGTGRRYCRQGRRSAFNGTPQQNYRAE